MKKQWEAVFVLLAKPSSDWLDAIRNGNMPYLKPLDAKAGAFANFCSLLCGLNDLVGGDEEALEALVAVRESGCDFYDAIGITSQSREPLLRVMSSAGLMLRKRINGPARRDEQKVTALLCWSRLVAEAYVALSDAESWQRFLYALFIDSILHGCEDALAKDVLHDRGNAGFTLTDEDRLEIADWYKREILPSENLRGDPFLEILQRHLIELDELHERHRKELVLLVKDQAKQRNRLIQFT
ncbi:MAG: hypothetical protein J6Z49_05460 [Kiritimatiellae bacterium]|nr:hypothetical protein [Kiritimatiellia bacterium]